ncbi:hypothetical protein DAPPUDRAFT_106731 [Daphnia pulex]|uniref:DUF659 domain-containing protein n=1 Tax=Daphnia pulex TaxID=6669 RepID=E9GUE9_DAPPU|nr:hypothetical protein DAPPUDRAFT_106731 [Daphnia pulex]|eukprot:EFX76860.1 hypothetical protein DAPPUDRAFT_106731 [Daphnia pulex]
MLLKHNERASMLSVKHAKTLVLNQFNSFRENLISSLSTTFQLEGKVKHIVTDNGSNFVKAMKEYMSSPSMANTAEVTVGDQSEDDLIEMEISDDDEATPITISSLFDILENFDVYGEKQQPTINIWLPAYIFDVQLIL